ncbi:MAG: hypothetical protein RL291_788 [Pseudomonadota bacterium]
MLELKIPPPIVGAIAAAGAWLVAGMPGLAALSSVPAPRLILAGALAAAGLVIDLAGVLAFLRAKTTVNPLRPDRTSQVVDTGIYAFTRNPMYLGFALVLAGWITLLGSVAGGLALPAFIAYITRFQIEPEERHLRAKFGAAYDAYCARVRRWV